MVKHVAFTAQPSNDVAGTRRWYEEILGLTFAGTYVGDGVEKYNGADLGDGCFSLIFAEWTNLAPASAGSVYFEVDDLGTMVGSFEGMIFGYKAALRPHVAAGINLRSRALPNHNFSSSATFDTNAALPHDAVATYPA